jgi:hypothetical protein
VNYKKILSSPVNELMSLSPQKFIQESIEKIIGNSIDSCLCSAGMKNRKPVRKLGREFIVFSPHLPFMEFLECKKSFTAFPMFYSKCIIQSHTE